MPIEGTVAVLVGSFCSLQSEQYLKKEIDLCKNLKCRIRIRFLSKMHL